MITTASRRTVRPARRRLRAALVLLLLAAVPTVAPAAPVEAAASDAAYVMTYFRESPNGSGDSDNVHLAVSRDGLKWTPLNDNRPILTPTTGTRGIRDPYLLRLQDGSWALFATDLAPGVPFATANPSIHLWTSPDLVSWSADRLISINAANPGSYTWAPSVFWDAGRRQYAVTYSAHPTNGPDGVIMVVYTTNFQTFSAPVRFFDNGGQGGVIDSAVITGIDGVNYLYYRGPSGGLFGARSATVNPGSFTTYSHVPPAQGCVEAPTVVRSLSDPSVWWLWGDNFCPNNAFEVWQGSVATGSWALKNKLGFSAPLGSKHNDIKTISGAEYDALLAAYGGSSTVRLKSSNFPDRFVRHSGFVGRIDPLPFDPQADAQFKIVAGLAGSNSVSLESANFPGRYFRSVAGGLRLDPPDGSSQFRSDASFVRVAGLADATLTSFRSATQPSLFLRHSNFTLSLTTITDATGRADATFDVVS